MIKNKLLLYNKSLYILNILKTNLLIILIIIFY